MELEHLAVGVAPAYGLRRYTRAVERHGLQRYARCALLAFGNRTGAVFRYRPRV